jgi:competence ComEA-like helix-hairpin-helix protein
MSKPKRNWRNIRDDFLDYTRAERNGVYVLMALILLVNGYRFYKNHYRVDEYDYTDRLAEIEEAYAGTERAIPKQKKLFPFNPNTVTEEEMQRLGFVDWKIKTFMKYRATGATFKDLDDFEKVYSIDSLDIARVKDVINFDQIQSKSKKPGSEKKKIKNTLNKNVALPTTPLFDFDPNTASEADLKKLGLSDRVVKTLIKFRSKGAFRKASDVGKIYGLKQDQFEKLLPYIQIKNTGKKPKYASNIQKDREIEGQRRKVFDKEVKVEVIPLKSIDINSATVEEWQRIKGIGPSYAGRIVKYRDMLGGFYEIEQIKETYGVVDSIYQKIEPYVKLSAPKDKIKINTIIEDSLARHPYLNWNQVKVIINYREKHGPFTKDEDVYGCRRLTKEEWKRLTPYFDYSLEPDSVLLVK